LDHPGIIPVYDMGRDAEGRLFFTMRLVKGRTLEEIFDLVRDGKEGCSVTRALGILQKVSEALAFAHKHGVIHRDLKPANIMVGRFGETYVMDWGLAKLFDANAVPAAESKGHDSTSSMQTICFAGTRPSVRLASSHQGRRS
jgi:serine/threonine protein kinase